jgi:hypothetical protein
MPQGPGTYGSKKGRPSKPSQKKKKTSTKLSEGVQTALQIKGTKFDPRPIA